jgi:hypothetical protein
MTSIPWARNARARWADAMVAARGMPDKCEARAGSIKKFFFEKKNQKTFANAVADSPESRRQHAQKFLRLFSKRRAFLT